MRVANKRFIKAMFDEISEEGRGLFSLSEGKFIEIEKTEEESVYRFLEEGLSSRIEVRVSLYDRSIEMELENNDGKFSLPNSVNLVEKRENVRLELSDLSLVAELKLGTRVFYGSPVDLNDSCTAIRVKDSDDFRVGSNIQVIIRKKNSKNILYEQSSLIKGFSESRVPETKVLLVARSQEQNSEKKARIANRSVPAFPTPITIRVKMPTDETVLISGSVSEMGVSGFSVSTSRKRDEKLRNLSGFPFESDYPKVSGYIVWNSEDTMGLRILSSDPETLVPWLSFLYSHTVSDDIKSASARDIGNILLESGFLTGKRRGSYHNKVSDNIVVPDQQFDLFHRRFVFGDAGSPALHFSLVRLTDTTWVLQEIAGSIKDSQEDEVKFTDRWKRLIMFLREESRCSRISPKNILVLYKHTVDNNVDTWSQFESKIGVVNGYAHHVHKESGANSKVEVVQRISMGSQEIFRNEHQSKLLYFMGLLSPRPNQMISIHSATHGIDPAFSLGAVETKDLSAVYYRLNAPYSENVTGILSTLFCFPFERRSSYDSLKGLSEITGEGTPDILAMIPDSMDSSGEGALFRFTVLDLTSEFDFE